MPVYLKRYNKTMRSKATWYWLALLIFSGLFLFPVLKIQASGASTYLAQSSNVTAYDLIIAMNTLRISYGLPALIEDPIINAVAQSTAEIMAANEMSWHIGDVRGRLAAAGYGGGATVWATENFAVGQNRTIDEIMLSWSDSEHMRPAVNPAYCNVGAGVATSPSGRTYYILQAAYTSNKACGEYTSVGGTTNQPGGSTDIGRAGGISQLIVPVKIATPDPDGRLFHIVQAGQSFWSIAIAYKITIRDIETWNNITRESKLQVGQRLFIPTSNTEGYATPTPVGMIVLSQPDRDGRIVHTVHAYQTLITIAQAYDISVDRILALNGIQVDWPLQIDQKLVIDPGNVTPSPTPRPLTPIEKLTPASDGLFYHTVSSGETLSWIASYYQINMLDLMAWNGLTASTIIIPGQKLELKVTPPATETATPSPETATPTATSLPPSPTLTSLPTLVEQELTQTPTQATGSGGSDAILFIAMGMALGGLVLIVFIVRNRPAGN